MALQSALAVAAWLFDGRQVSPSGKLLQRVILLGPTLFPLAFAGLGGRTMNNLTLWRAERGSTIGVSNQLTKTQI